MQPFLQLSDRRMAYIGRLKGVFVLTLAHELGHIILHPIEIIGDLKLARTNDIIPTYRNPEWQANTFAGELLAPSKLIVGMDKEEISERCKISLEAAGIRYSNVSGESLLHKKRATV